jgi:hypothetical protein
MKAMRLHSDGAGGTRYTEVEVGGGAKTPIPTLEMMVGVISGPVMPFHPAPFRAFITALHGEVEVGATSGETHRFGPGDWLMVDDVGTPGHTTRAVGAECRLIRCRVPDDWNGWS